MKSYRQIFKYDSKLGYKYVKNLSLTILGDSVEGSKDYKLVTDNFGFRNDINLNCDMAVDNLFIGCSFTAGDGVSNSERFTDNLNTSSYNAGISGSGFVQQCLIAEYCANFIQPKRLIISPYIGCIQRNFLKERSTQLMGYKKLWYKPYAEFSNNKVYFRNIPVPKPDLNFEDFSSQKSVNIENNFFEKLKSKFYRRREFIEGINKNYSSYEQFEICKYCIKLSMSYFKNSQIFIMPIPNWSFQKLTNRKLIFKVKNFYESIAKDLQINHFFLPEYLDKGKIDKMFYFEGHMNKFGHQVVSEILKKEIL